MASTQNLDSLMAIIDAQPTSEPVKYCFKATRLVNLQTTEQLKARELDFTVGHRFDDLAGKSGGYSTFYGLDNSRDIRLALTYGINDRWAVGIGRNKGAHLRRQIVDLNTKVKIIQQKTRSSPVNISLYATAEISTMKSSSDTLSITYYRKDAHRINYVSQVIISRKFNSRFSCLLAPTLVYRNLVNYTQKNALFALAGGFRFLITKRIGIIGDYLYVFNKASVTRDFIPPLGLGLEFETGGHVFHIVFSNNPSLSESQFATETTDKWRAGEVRFGFNISRVFSFRQL
jgi:hypothetical protein